jgi:plasmid stabilization system protein ParE
MALRVRWTGKALKRFDSIVTFLNKDWGARVTEQFVKRTFELLYLISEHPLIGTLESEEMSIRGLVVTKHNKIFYRIDDKKQEIILLNIYDNRSSAKKF